MRVLAEGMFLGIHYNAMTDDVSMYHCSAPHEKPRKIREEQFRELLPHLKIILDDAIEAGKLSEVDSYD